MNKIYTGLGLGSAAFLMIITLTGCKKEKTEPFIGKWEMQFLHIVSFVNDTILGDTTKYYDPGEGRIEYYPDHTGKVYILATQNDNFSWSVKGDSIRFMIAGQSDIYMHYAVSGSTFTWYSTMNVGTYIKNPSYPYREEWYVWARKL